MQPGDGGVARVVTDLVRGQLAAGLRVAVACPPGTELAAAVRAEGADAYDWRAGRDPGPRLVGETRELARLLRTVRPALVHAHSAKAGLCARLALRGRIPTVYQPHAWSFEAVEGTTAALARGWERWAARWTDRVLCVSEAERRTGESAGVRASWSVIHNGVDAARFTPEGGSAAPGPGPAGATGGPLVVCVGRLCRQKGQDVLLDAWPTVLAEVPDARLVLVGDGPERERLEALTRELGVEDRVTFLGKRRNDEMPGLLSSGDLAIFPSLMEATSVAALESMACELPVAASRVGGLPEIVDDQVGGLFEPADPRSLADVVVRLLESGRLEEMGKRARARVVENWSNDRLAERHLEIYRTLLARPRKR